MLPKTLQTYVDFMARENRPVKFEEIIASYPGRANSFRFLKQRGLVENVVRGYEPGETYTGPRTPKYILTEKGRAQVTTL